MFEKVTGHKSQILRFHWLPSVAQMVPFRPIWQPWVLLVLFI